MDSATIREILVEPASPESNVFEGEAHGANLDKKNLVALTGVTLSVQM